MNKTRPLLLVLACFAVLVMRIGGAHLHVCLDGSEPPHALHFADSGLHHDEADAAGHAAGDDHGVHHDDVEVDLASDLISKLSSLELPVVAGLLFIVLLLLPWGRTPMPEVQASVRHPRKLPHLRPPLRGPPLPSFA